MPKSTKPTQTMTRALAMSVLKRGAAAAALLVPLAGPTVAQSQAEKPQHGGTLNIGMVYVTLSPLSWDPAAWAWKFQQDTGLMYEQLFAGDLSKSQRRGGKHSFRPDAWLATDAIRGELAESWKWKDNPLRVEVKLRKGVMFPEKPGVMKSRELVAQDVVESYYRLDKSPKKIPTYFDHVRRSRRRQAHGGVRIQGIQRRVGLPLRLGLFLGHRSQGGG